MAPEPSRPMITPEQIETFARNPANHDAFAEVLARVLPDYTRFQWGQPSAYKRHFLRWQQAGFTLYPNHYYSPLPDLTRLPSKRITARSNLLGIRIDAPAMLALGDSFASRFGAEYAAFDSTAPNLEGRFHFGNGVFERVDAEVLHCMVRHHRPRRLIEIGSGYSSLVSAAACQRNRDEGSPCDLTLVEPYPNDILLKQIPGISRLVSQCVEECPIALFEELEAGDILFIDSSHVIRCGNDVEYEFFEIIPRLRPGVIVHVHDIFLPHRYPANWVSDELIFWNEQYLVEALLTHNRAFEILWAGCYLHTYHPEQLASQFPGYSPQRSLPGSFWFVRR